ncbi:MAG: TIGR02450 family Trp-rich protein [Gammaproteobacteria bacterium]
MNRINPKKLLQSKWTAVTPLNKEKHFLVTGVVCDEAGVARSCILEAVHSQRETELDWRELKNAEQWLMGWQ